MCCPLTAPGTRTGVLPTEAPGTRTGVLPTEGPGTHTGCCQLTAGPTQGCCQLTAGPTQGATHWQQDPHRGATHWWWDPHRGATHRQQDPHRGATHWWWDPHRGATQTAGPTQGCYPLMVGPTQGCCPQTAPKSLKLTVHLCMTYANTFEKVHTTAANTLSLHKQCFWFYTWRTQHFLRQAQPVHIKLMHNRGALFTEVHTQKAKLLCSD